MLLIILATPLALLCFFLAFLTWRRRFRRQAVTLLVVGLTLLSLAIIIIVSCWHGYFHLLTREERSQPIPESQTIAGGAVHATAAVRSP